MLTPCLSDDELAAFADGSSSEAARVNLHVAGCAECRVVLAELARPTRPSQPSDDEPLRRGSALGRYRIEECIGSGGMGIVYAAVDPELGRRVAIKVLPSRGDEAELRARFDHERRILAQLDHPSVCRLLDGGQTSGGRAYLVMELIEGQPIDRYCDRLRLSVAARLALFRQVCAAVHAAHQHLVVHRDLKPSNILVTAAGVPKLLDFGIAKLLTQHTGLTATGRQPLTPSTASPEQVKSLTITTASDVYSLGVVLCELLTGMSPYQVPREHSVLQLLEAVVSVEPLAPSVAVAAAPDATVNARGVTRERLARQLRGDVDTIVLKALRKEPERRYRTAHELSEDLRLHLEGLPVAARADTVGYRAGKFVRRHRTGVAAAALLIASLVGGIVSTARQAQLAERRFDESRRLIHTVIFDVEPKMSAVTGTTALRKELIESTLKYLEALVRDVGDNPPLLRELVSSYVQLARVQGLQGESNVGNPQAARKTLGEAEKLVERLLALEPDGPDALHEASVVSRAVALCFLYDGKRDSAQQHARRSIELAERAVKLRPDFQARAELADAHRALANSADSAEEFARSRDLYEALLIEKPDAPLALRNLSQVNKYLAGLHYRKQEYREGLALIQKSRAIDEKLLAVNPDAPQAQVDLAYSLSQLSFGLANLGELADGLDAIQQVVAIHEKLAARDPEDLRIQERLGYSYMARGRVRGQMKDNTSARPDYEKSHSIYAELRARGYGGAYVASELALTKLALGQMAEEDGRLAEACNWYSQAAAVYGELASRDAVLPNHAHDAAAARRHAEECAK